MSDSTWTFRTNTLDELVVVPPPDVDPTLVDALQSWLLSDVGTRTGSIDDYRETLRMLRSGQTDAVSGNAARQELDGNDLIFEALYDQWETFRLPAQVVDELLAAYSVYAAGRR